MTETGECVPHEWAEVDTGLFVFDDRNETHPVLLSCLDWVSRYADAAAFKLVQPANSSVANRTLAELAFSDALPRSVRAAMAASPGVCHFACSEGHQFVSIGGVIERAWCVPIIDVGVGGECTLALDTASHTLLQRYVAGAHSAF